MDTSPRSSAAPKQIAVFDPSLPASPGKERDFEKFLGGVRAVAVAHAEFFIGYDAAQDALQKAMIEAWGLWDSMLPEERTHVWFLHKVHSRVVDQLRRQRRYVPMTEELEAHYDFPRVVSVAESTEDEAWRRWVDDRVEAMPLRRKEVFIHVRDLGMTYEEAAEALGISPRTVEVQLRIVRDYFLKALEHAGVVVTDGTMRKLLPPKTGASDE